MPEIINCPSCQRKLRVPDELLGQRVQCPTCSTTFEAAAPAVVPISAVAPPAPAPAEQHVQLSLDDEPQAVPAPAPPARRDHGPGDLEPFQCPRCDNSISPTAVRCRYCGAYLGRSGDWRDEAPYEYGLRHDCEPHRASLVLTLGILGVVLTCLAPLGLAISIPAWVMGYRDLAKMRAGLMDPAGKGSTNGGYVCGIVGTVLQVVCGCGQIAQVMLELSKPGNRF